MAEPDDPDRPDDEPAQPPQGAPPHGRESDPAAAAPQDADLFADPSEPDPDALRAASTADAPLDEQPDTRPDTRQDTRPGLSSGRPGPYDAAPEVEHPPGSAVEAADTANEPWAEPFGETAAAQGEARDQESTAGRVEGFSEAVGREDEIPDVAEDYVEQAAPQAPEPDAAEAAEDAEADWTPNAEDAPEQDEQLAARAPLDDAAQLPPNFFRAAGDPDEPLPEPDATLLGRMRARLGDTARDLRDWAGPRWVAFTGAARGFGLGAWRGMRGLKHPRNVREAAVWSGWAAAGFMALLVGFFVFVTWGMPSADDVWEARQGQSITFLDRNGHVILREGAQNAPPVDLASLPPYVQDAFIAIEDRRFHEHWGVDFSGMMRAGAENLRAGRVVQGGSTITQQLAKNLFLTNERSWRRKAQEVALAIWLEGRFTKDEILALYLSRVYFGAGAYGIEAAAERYFDRPARELTLLQAAMLAGLVKAPSRLNPARQDIAAARERAQLVLNEMVSMGAISAAEREAAMREEIEISRRNPAGILGYYRDWIDPLLNDEIGQERDDFIVETTIDIASQRAAAAAVEAVLAEQGEARRVDQAALLAMDDQGGVRAMVGGRDYNQSQFNRTWQARRQPGSSFKFFIYLAAMENGLTPWSIREDAPVTVGDWSPGNYTNEFRGPVSLTSAFMHSYNSVAIRVANEVGHERVIEVAQRLGVTAPLHNYRSLALGAQEISMLEMTQAYGAMASGGYRVEAHGVVRIRRANNNETMWSWRPQHHDLVIEERPRRLMDEMMLAAVQAGTGTRARRTERQIAGKTGTGNDYRDAWFIGFTPGFVAAVWVGNDNFAVTDRVTGGSLPADIWARFAEAALQNVPVRALDMPREEDYGAGVPAPDGMHGVAAVGAPIGATIGAPTATPPDTEDRSLDFGPEG